MSRTRKGRVHQSLGRRLSLVIMLVFSLYLLSASLFAYVIYHQYTVLVGTLGSHFERAMIAAELTRDAESIAAEVYELLVGNDRSISAGNRRVDNLAQIYQATRKRLEPLSEADTQALDRWQTPFFSSLDRLNERLRAEQELQATQFQRVDMLFLLLQRVSTLEQGEALPGAERRFVGHALAGLGYAAAALSAERPGHIARLTRYCRQQMQEMMALPLTHPDFITLREQLAQELPDVFASRSPLLRAWPRHPGHGATNSRAGAEAHQRHLWLSPAAQSIGRGGPAATKGTDAPFPGGAVVRVTGAGADHPGGPVLHSPGHYSAHQSSQPGHAGPLAGGRDAHSHRRR
ncbi:hypothetical protein MBH78_16360 [Oceanimonas sp. NS1]|nr:hypothetical protein [Oceanimonas sp. NS1]